MANDYRGLRVWEESMLLAEDVYRLARLFPGDERFGLTAQVRRAAVSVPSCIAEGNARHSTRDYLRFVSMAMGSLAELETQILLATRLGHVSPEEAEPVRARCRSVAMLMQALRKALNVKVADAAAAPPFPDPRSRL